MIVRDPQVIEAAVNAQEAYWSQPHAVRDNEDQIEWAARIDREVAEAAITAADETRKPSILAALDRLETAFARATGAAMFAGPLHQQAAQDEVSAARRALLALVGIGDGETVTEGE